MSLLALPESAAWLLLCAVPVAAVAMYGLLRRPVDAPVRSGLWMLVALSPLLVAVGWSVATLLQPWTLSGALGTAFELTYVRSTGAWLAAALCWASATALAGRYRPIPSERVWPLLIVSGVSLALLTGVVIHAHARPVTFFLVAAALPLALAAAGVSRRPAEASLLRGPVRTSEREVLLTVLVLALLSVVLALFSVEADRAVYTLRTGRLQTGMPPATLHFTAACGLSLLLLGGAVVAQLLRAPAAPLGARFAVLVLVALVAGLGVERVSPPRFADEDTAILEALDADEPVLVTSHELVKEDELLAPALANASARGEESVVLYRRARLQEKTPLGMSWLQLPRAARPVTLPFVAAPENPTAPWPDLVGTSPVVVADGIPLDVAYLPDGSGAPRWELRRPIRMRGERHRTVVGVPGPHWTPVDLASLHEDIARYGGGALFLAAAPWRPFQVAARAQERELDAARREANAKRSRDRRLIRDSFPTIGRRFPAALSGKRSIAWGSPSTRGGKPLPPAAGEGLAPE